MSLKIRSVRNTEHERVHIDVLGNINLRGYALVDNTYDQALDQSNQHVHIYFFPSINVVLGDIIYVYSGVGKNRVEKHPNGKNSIYHLYDGGKEFVWNNTGDVARILKFEIIDTLNVPVRRILRPPPRIR